MSINKDQGNQKPDGDERKGQIMREGITNKESKRKR